MSASWSPMLVAVLVCGGVALAQDGSEEAHSVTLCAGDLTVVVGDDTDHGAGKAGYEGIWSLTHRLRDINVFVPRYAGLITYRQPCTVVQLSDAVAEIRPDDPRIPVKRYEVVAPHYIDYTVFGQGGGTSYMNAPEDPGIYLITSSGEWMRHYDPIHGSAASILPEGMPVPEVQKVPDSPYPSGAKGFSDSFTDLRFDPERALFYGNIDGGMVLIFMFERGHDVIPYMSPSGGGRNVELGRNNPAWDFRYKWSNFAPGEPLVLRNRIVYKKFVSRDDILAEYAAWRASLAAADAATP